MAQRGIPSQTVNEPWIYANKRKFDTADKTYLGFWTVFPNQTKKVLGSVTELDSVWSKISQFCSCDALFAARASTVATNPGKLKRNGTICCYTKDYRDQEDVKSKAALVRTTLRGTLQFKVLYYKLDLDSKECLYCQKKDGTFWKSTGDNSWELV